MIKMNSIRNTILDTNNELDGFKITRKNFKQFVTKIFSNHKIISNESTYKRIKPLFIDLNSRNKKFALLTQVDHLLLVVYGNSFQDSNVNSDEIMESE